MAGSLDALTKVVLLNAAYFKGTWLKAFNPSKSKMKPFYVDATHDPVPTKMMVHKRTSRLEHGYSNVVKLVV